MTTSSSSLELLMGTLTKRISSQFDGSRTVDGRQECEAFRNKAGDIIIAKDELQGRFKCPLVRITKLPTSRDDTPR